MKPGDRLVAAFVSSQEVGTAFSAWPLHITIVPWFRLPDETRAITEGLAKALSHMVPFEAAGGETAMFGPRKNRPATLIVRPTPFVAIERKIRNYLLKKRAWLVDETTKRHFDFRPHVTVQNEQKLSAGEVFVCDRLYIVEQKGGNKEIVGEVMLG